MQHHLPPLYHIIGSRGSGKTTFCRLLIDSISTGSKLVLHTGPDTLFLEPEEIALSKSLDTLLAHYAEQPLSLEKQDIIFQNAPVVLLAHEDTDYFNISLSSPVSPLAQQMLDYAFPRLLSHYDIVLFDGPLPPLLPRAVLKHVHSIILVQPDEGAPLPQASVVLPETAYVVLSPATAQQDYPDWVKLHIQSGRWQGLGKIPPIQNYTTNVIPDYVRDCLSRLSYPFNQY
jgi:hypothetical protein